MRHNGRGQIRSVLKGFQLPCSPNSLCSIEIEASESPYCSRLRQSRRATQAAGVGGCADAVGLLPLVVVLLHAPLRFGPDLASVIEMKSDICLGVEICCRYSKSFPASPPCVGDLARQENHLLPNVANDFPDVVVQPGHRLIVGNQIIDNLCPTPEFGNTTK